MGNEYRAKVFKSDTSVAWRLPKAAGFRDGQDVRLVKHDDDTITFWREDDSSKLLMGLYGSMSPGFMAEGRGDILQEERDWSAAAADPAEAA